MLELAEDIENLLGVKLEVISGGGTSSLLLVENGTVPPGINQIRVGEGILLGTDTTHDREISWLHQDAFRLRAEVIELKAKPSIPIGTVGRDAFGNIPSFVDRGIRKRAILALGKQDVPPEGIRPVDENVHILGGSSDHLIVDVTDSERKVEVGSDIAFFPNYPGLLYLSGSRYVKKIFKGGKQCWNWYRENSQSASGASSRLKPRLSAAEALTSGR
ncbi:MAG: hypothetical protein QHH02_01900 [Syntrophomonadaceae bacterium]|nr:hypothetical protein [Syntrophomonadaceae bacterium]